jgi:hypothetical protein
MYTYYLFKWLKNIYLNAYFYLLLLFLQRNIEMIFSILNSYFNLTDRLKCLKTNIKAFIFIILSIILTASLKDALS